MRDLSKLERFGAWLKEARQDVLNHPWGPSYHARMFKIIEQVLHPGSYERN